MHLTPDEELELGSLLEIEGSGNNASPQLVRDLVARNMAMKSPVRLSDLGRARLEELRAKKARPQSSPGR